MLAIRHKGEYQYCNADVSLVCVSDLDRSKPKRRSRKFREQRIPNHLTDTNSINIISPLMTLTPAEMKIFEGTSSSGLKHHLQRVTLIERDRFGASTDKSGISEQKQRLLLPLPMPFEQKFGDFASWNRLNPCLNFLGIHLQESILCPKKIKK